MPMSAACTEGAVCGQGDCPVCGSRETGVQNYVLLVQWDSDKELGQGPVAYGQYTWSEARDQAASFGRHGLEGTWWIVPLKEGFDS